MSDIKEKIIEEVKKIFDPEIPVNIYELGLIYKIDVDEKNKVNVDMTLTSPNCPVAESLPNEVKESIMKVDGVSDVNLQNLNLNQPHPDKVMGFGGNVNPYVTYQVGNLKSRQFKI